MAIVKLVVEVVMDAARVILGLPCKCGKSTKECNGC